MLHEAMYDLIGSMLRTGGPRHALAYLNARVAQRFTGLYRRAGDRLHCIVLQDKQGIGPLFLHDVPVDESYCQFAMRDGLFQTDDARVDMRLRGHPLQQLVLSYHSMPLKSASGDWMGTVSHFDLQPCALDSAEFEFLKIAAQLLPEVLDWQVTGSLPGPQDGPLPPEELAG